MRFLKVLTVGMGVLILVATTLLVVLIARRVGAPGPGALPFAVLLDEPAGTRIAGVTGAGDRLAVWLSGAGSDRVVLMDPRSGGVVGRIGLRGSGP
jgi:hypothetical protein